MLTALRKPSAPSGAAALSALLSAFGNTEAGPLSRAEDSVLGRLWSETGTNLPSTARTQIQYGALARLGRFLLDGGSGGADGRHIRDLNTVVQVVNRVGFGRGKGVDQATLGMAAVAAAVEPSRLHDDHVGDLTRWFALQAVPSLRLEHLLPSAFVRALCGGRGAQEPPAARWLMKATPMLQSRFPHGWPDRAAAINWLLGPERHALDYVRPMLSDPGSEPPAASACPVEVYAAPLMSGETIDFGADGNCEDYCIKDTWHELEPGWRWGRTPAALLTFCPVVARGTRVFLMINFSLPRDLIMHQQAILTVTVGRRAVLHDRWDTITQEAVTLDLGIAPPPGTILPVAFQLWPPFRPSDLLGWPDERSLGIGVSRLRLVAW
jgi:hypothetical protein